MSEQPTGALDRAARIAEKSANRNRLIEKFAKENNLQRREVKVKDHTVVVLDGIASSHIPEGDLANCIAQYIIASKRSMGGDCYFIAAAAVDSGAASGVIGTFEGVSPDLMDRANHFINYVALSDNTTAAFDLTAGYYIDGGQGNFQILMIRDKDLDTVVKRTQQLYGGEWNEVATR